mgnify:CR=1 FL=1
MPITQYLHHQRFSPAAIRLRAMTNETETLTSGIGRGKAYGQGLLTVARAGERHG